MYFSKTYKQTNENGSERWSKKKNSPSVGQLAQGQHNPHYEPKGTYIHLLWELQPNNLLFLKWLVKVLCKTYIINAFFNEYITRISSSIKDTLRWECITYGVFVKTEVFFSRKKKKKKQLGGVKTNSLLKF